MPIYPDNPGGSVLRFGVTPMITALLTILALSTSARAATPALQWDDNADADYYVVYWHTANQTEFTGHSEPIPAGTLTFPLGDCPDGQTYSYSVKAFNACHNSSDFSDEIKTDHCPYANATMADQPPAEPLSVEIILPDQDTKIIEKTPIEFSANAYENNRLTDGNAIIWSSDLDGAIGKGADMTSPLTQGRHILTASLKNDAGVTASNSVHVTVLPNAPPIITILKAQAGEATSNGQTYTLTGQASDGEDGDLSNKIIWLSDLDGGLGTGATLCATLTSGHHTIQAKVADTVGQTEETSISFTVAKWNTPPTLSITCTLAEAPTPDGQECTFSGSATDPEDGDLGASIAWASNLSGPIGTGRSLHITLPQGHHVIQATITDSGGKTIFARREITVTATDTPPSLKLQPVVEGAQDETGQQGSFAATADDPEDGDLSDNIIWTSSLQGILGTGSAIEVHLDAGIHTITARIHDSAGNQSEASINIGIDAINHPPSVSDITVFTGTLSNEGQTCTLSTRATDSEDGDLGSSVSWSSSLDGDLGTGSVIKALLSYGQHTLRATVLDSMGNTGERTKTLSLTWVNQEPVVTILGITAGAAGKEGQVFTLKGRAMDSEDGDLSEQLAWASDRDGDLGTGAELWATLSSGPHIITALVRDHNDQRVMASRTLSVEPFNEPPSVTILGIVAGDTSPQGQTYEFSGKARDAEDGIMSDSLVWVSDRDGILGKGPTIRAVLSGGAHIVQASVMDSQGKKTTSTTEISARLDTELAVQVKSRRFYYFNIVTISWAGGLSDVALFKNNSRIGSGGPEGSRYYWSSGMGTYKVCEMDGGRCSDEQSPN